MMRATAIWVCGLLACAIAGGGIGSLLHVGPISTNNGLLFGPLAGMLAFACARLWITEPRKGNDLPRKKP